ncbi:MAG: GTP-binding protein EngB [Euryarchaeota archaeon]|nr:GTP-binding protein EngB [Euryarchaeota archaeon]
MGNRSPPAIIFVGRSNVGKSSLIRLLTGKKVRIGRRPGTTLKPSVYELEDLSLIDMPGFGFMEGISKERQEKIKTTIVQYIEKNRKNFLFAVEVLDAKAFPEIVERWYKRGEIPIDIEMFDFLRELGLNPIVVANKVDKIGDRDQQLNKICELLGLALPWRQWLDTIVPLSAKTGEGYQHLRTVIRLRLKELNKEKLIKNFR